MKVDTNNSMALWAPFINVGGYTPTTTNLYFCSIAQKEHYHGRARTG